MQMSRMHWGNSPPSALTRPKPYQGVRVREPVKELLRRRRSLVPPSTQIAPPVADAAALNSQSSNPQAEPSTAVSDGGLQAAGWRAAPLASSAGLHPAAGSWSSSDCSQQERSAQTPASICPVLTADVYMQTLCPSYTMLTYTHTPLLANCGTIPVSPAPASLHQMELPDSGLTYLPWAPPLTTISTLPNPGIQFAPGSASLTRSPLVHMPLSMSLTTMLPPLECQGLDPQPQILNIPQRLGHQLESEPHGQSGDGDPGAELEPQSLLDKLLGDEKTDGDAEDKNSYSSSLFILSG